MKFLIGSLLLLAPLLGCAGLLHGAEGVNAGECSDAADNDADGLFDCDDSDCVGSPSCHSQISGDTGEPDSDDDSDTQDSGSDDTGDELPDRSEGEYQGTIVGDLGDGYACSGDVEFTIDARGAVAGRANCAVEGSYDFEGALTGDEDGGEVALVWVAILGDYEMVIDGAGTYADGGVEAELGYDSGWGEYTFTVEVERR